MPKQTALADETETAKRNVEYKQRVYCNANTVANNAAAAQDAHSSCERPCNENQIHGHSDNDGNANSTEERGNDEREKRVAYDGDGLEEGTACSC